MTAMHVEPSPDGVPGAVTEPRRIRAEAITFTGHGGVAVNGYLAVPAADGPHPGIVVIHEAGGLGEHIRDVANRFANIGYSALAVDLYTREGGPPPMDDMQKVMARLFAMPDATALGGPGGRGRRAARARGREREGRLHRLLHGRALHAAVRLRQRPARRGRRLLGRLHRPRRARASARATRARRRRWTWPGVCIARCWRRSAPRTRTPRRRSVEELRQARAGERPGGEGRRLRRRRPRVLRRLPPDLPAGRGRTAVGRAGAVPRLAPRRQLIGAGAGRWQAPHAAASGSIGGPLHIVRRTQRRRTPRRHHEEA